MKIAYLSHCEIPAQLANAIHVVNMCSAFAGDGHEVRLYARGAAATMEDVRATYGVENAFALALRSRGAIPGLSRMWYGFSQAYRAMGSGAPHVFYARCPACAFFALLLGGDVIFEAHQIPRKRAERWIQRRMLKHRRLRRLVAISRALLDDLRSEFPGLVDRVDCLVAPDAASVVADAEPFALERGPGRQIGYAGGLRDGNGLSLILDLAAAFSGDTFHVLGGAPDEIAHWRARQKSANVRWYGRRPPTHVPGFLAACDVLLAPYQDGPKTNSGSDTSRWMSPLKIFEYMASGTAMIASDYPVLREVLSEDIAELPPPAARSAWMRSLERLNDERTRARLGSRAREVFRERYTWEARARNVLRGLESDLLRTGDAPPAGTRAESPIR